MDADQNLALDTVLAGHNLLLVGQAGTGKTLTIKECVRQLRYKGKIVALTCYTGIAGLQYQGLDPMTLHQFAGLEDGRYSDEHLLHLILTDERYIDTKSRIMTTDVLVIDELSMVSKKIFERVEFLCRKVKANLLFGGIQLLLCGDFYQLPPIKDELYGDKGEFCFQSSAVFNQLLPHRIQLSTVHRQSDRSLIKCINELEKGKPSDETNSVILSLCRPLSPEVRSKTVKLFARNIDVDLYNYECLQSIDNPLHVFEADDSGDCHYLNKLLAPKRLGIKIDSPVMLLRNLNNRFVNGLTGRVLTIEPDSIKVAFKFDGVPETVNVTKYCFTKYDPATNKCVAKRYQFPLRLAYAMTIHKAQGMTIPYLEIDCKNASNPGQIGVAIGRAESLSGLRVINYTPTVCRKHPDIINVFYEHIQGIGNTEENLNCCKADVPLESLVNETESQRNSSDIEEYNNLVKVLINIDTDERNTEDYTNNEQIEIEHSYSSGPLSICETTETTNTEHDYSIKVSSEIRNITCTGIFLSHRYLSNSGHLSKRDKN